MVSKIFMAEEEENICSMAINPSSQSDKLVWVGTKRGLYCP